MPTSADVIAKAGPPKQDKKIMGLFKWGMSTRYKRVLAELDRYDARIAANTSTQAQQRKVEAKSLQEVLASIGNAANAYIAAHSSSKDPESKVRTSIMGSLVQGAVSEGVQLPAIAADSSFDVGGKTAGMLWKTAVARHLASDSLGRGRELLRSEQADKQRSNDLFSQKDALDPTEFKKRKNDLDKAFEKKAAQIEAHYTGALGTLAANPDALTGMPLRDIAEILVESYRRSGIERTDEIGKNLASIASSTAIGSRIGQEASNQAERVAAKSKQVEDGLRGTGATFTDAELQDIMLPEENIVLILNKVSSSFSDRKLPVPSWVNAASLLSQARTVDAARAFRRARPGVKWDELPKSVTAPYTLLGPTNPIAEWAKPVFKGSVVSPERAEDSRLTGDANFAVTWAERTAKLRAPKDEEAARERLASELGVPENEVEDLLRRSLLVLASAPLTINFSHQHLDRILNSGGFKNYWEVNQAIAEPPKGTSKDDETQIKYDYQQKRLKWEGALFRGTTDLTTKFRKASQQAISTGVNIGNAPMGAAPALDYGRSVAVLKESVKRRATYTPWDQEQLLNRMKEGSAVVGPEFVSSPSNLAAVIRYADKNTVKDIVEAARNPGRKVQYAPAAYVEAQIHGPIALRDIEKLTICTDDVENSAWDKLEAQYGRSIPGGEATVKREADVLRKSIEQTLTASGIKFDFQAMPQ